MADPPPIPTCQALIEELLPIRYPTIDHAAGLLGIPVRTLQRRLREGGQSYSQLVEAIRFQQACRHLEESGAQAADVAKALGYADPSSFSRAFRRWTGMSPSQYQRRR